MAGASNAQKQWRRYLTIAQKGEDTVERHHHVANGVYLKPGRYEILLENYDPAKASGYLKKEYKPGEEKWCTWLYFLARSVEGPSWRLEFDILPRVGQTAPEAQANFNQFDEARRTFELPVDAQVTFNISYDRENDSGQMCVVFTKV